MDSDYLTLLRAEPVTISELVWSSQTSLYLAGGTLVHIVAAVGFRAGVLGVRWVWACLVGMVAQVPWSALPQVLACMSVVLHYFPLNSHPASSRRPCQSPQVPPVNQVTPSL